MQYLIIIRTVLALLPAVLEAVKVLEGAFPVAGQGAAKLAALRSIIEAAYNTVADATLSFEKLWPALQSTIGAVVSLANSTGLFKK
ncbi:MAG: hypothetical protein IPL15_10325 [Comamonadaceae bacterium]|jgi:hypothetical protein|uniref:hypothetical protein n=1 Tax=Candidatus Skiveiella danica TaxID=3386177 RepID=UPI00390B3EAB|nr:hypothetical protein [Comamonadaceae bacterium]